MTYAFMQPSSKLLQKQELSSPSLSTQFQITWLNPCPQLQDAPIETASIISLQQKTPDFFNEFILETANTFFVFL